MDLSVETLTSPDPETLRDVAVLEIVAWGRTPELAEVEARTQRLLREIGQLDPAAKGIFVARDSGAIVGVGRVMRSGDSPVEWMVYALAVHPECRRQGIGRALLAARIAFARSHGARTIRSETHADNRISIAYHEAVGFVNEGRFTAPDGDEKIAFLMPLAG